MLVRCQDQKNTVDYFISSRIWIFKEPTYGLYFSVFSWLPDLARAESPDDKYYKLTGKPVLGVNDLPNSATKAFDDTDEQQNSWSKG
jgi:hypothetical protein